MARGKKYRQVLDSFDRNKTYNWEEGVDILKSTPARGFDETVELMLNLGIDGRQADQALRGTVMLPHGTGQEIRALVLTQGELVQQAEEAGADYVGGAEFIEKIQEGLVADVTFGVDMTNARGVNFNPFGWDVDGFTGSNVFGQRSIGDRNNREVTGDFKLSWTNDFGENISNTLLAGAQGFISQTTTTGGAGNIFPGPGLEVASAASTQSVVENWLRVVNAGGYLQDQIGFNDWVFVTLGGRWDANSAFGEEFETAFYPKAWTCRLSTPCCSRWMCRSRTCWPSWS